MSATFHILLVSLMGSAAQAHMGQPLPLPANESEIVVTARPAGGAAAILPELVFEPAEISAFGAGTIDELLEGIAPQTQTAGAAEPPLVIVNGRRVPGGGGVGSLPPEAVKSIEVLAERAAQTYGERTGRRVINIVLKDRFSALTTEVQAGWATDGGRELFRPKASLANTGDHGRWNVEVSLQRDAALLESERGLGAIDSGFRTLLPAGEEWNIAAGLVRTLGRNLEASASANATRTRLDSLIGLDPEGRTLRNPVSIETANVGIGLSGDVGWGWRWSLVGNLAKGTTISRIGTGWQQEYDTGTRLETQDAALDMLVTGSLARLPAGRIGLSVKLAHGSSTTNGRLLAGGGDGETRLKRARTGAQLNLDLPLTSRRNAVLPWLGDLAVNMQARIDHLSDFGSLGTLGAGFAWSPVRQVAITGQIVREAAAPSPEQLGAPLLRTVNVRTYDFVRGEAVDVDRIDGGNPDLGRSRQTVIRLAANVRPATGLIINSSYSLRRSIGNVVAFPVPTAEIERAFPARFGRDANGRLVLIDNRPVNVGQSDVRELRTGFNWRLPWPAAGGGRMNVSLHHGWRLRDRAVIMPGLPELDFLAGAVGEGSMARARHSLSLRAAVYRKGVGARITADWRGAARARQRGSDDLAFSALATVGLRLFADLGVMAPDPWTKGMRVSLEAVNLFNARQRVRNASGFTPYVFSPAFVDPVGRNVSISLRKQF